MPDYKTHDPKGWCGDPKRGAALGRATIHDAPADALVKLTVKEVKLDDGGYDELGTYWGATERTQIYWYANEEGTVDACMRATSHEDAERKIRAHYPRAEFADSPERLDDFARAYLTCALWSSMDDDGEPFDAAHSINDIASEALAQAKEDCAAFQRDCEHVLADAYLGTQMHPNYDAASAGHDFWLTRNRHGAGFWDRGLGRTGRDLTEEAHAYGECDLYIGDDGKVHGF